KLKKPRVSLMPLRQSCSASSLSTCKSLPNLPCKLTGRRPCCEPITAILVLRPARLYVNLLAPCAWPCANPVAASHN
ncbi:hypothetical protein HAX54_052451, partial [Datura stramonium]|nr:hypothetical protein [Datura stramonium]